MDKPNFAIEVIVRKSGLEIANGMSVEAAIPKKEGEYDMETLSQILMRLKERYPDKKDATVLMEPDIEYDYLVQVMDVVRGAALNVEENEEKAETALFPEISIGDAP